MASVVDICNLALAHIGDDATVSSIDPPEGSAQAEHCKRFYAIARDTMLQMHNWNFASKRISLAQVTNPITEWLYAYAAPSDMSVAVSILASDAGDDYSARFVPTDTPFFPPVVAAGQYTPQPYSIEVDTIVVCSVFELASCKHACRSSYQGRCRICRSKALHSDDGWILASSKAVGFKSKEHQG